MTPQKIARLAVLSALCIALRYAFSGFPNVQPVTAIFLVISITIGWFDSLVVASVTMLISSFLLGFGPWVIWQIMSFSVIILLWHFVVYPMTIALLPESAKHYHLSAEFILSVFAAVMGFLYGMVIDSSMALLYGSPIIPYVLAGTPYNIAHAVSTAVFYPVITYSFRRIVLNEKN